MSPPLGLLRDLQPLPDTDCTYDERLWSMDPLDTAWGRLACCQHLATLNFLLLLSLGHPQVACYGLALSLGLISFHVEDSTV